MDRHVSVYKGHIFFGHGDDQTAIDAMEREDVPAGFCTRDENGEYGREWFVFPGIIYHELVREDKLKKQVMASTEAVETVMKTFTREKGERLESALGRVSDSIAKERESIERRGANKYIPDEEFLYNSYMSGVNDTVLHEVCLHLAGDLIHKKLPVMIRFSGSRMDPEELQDTLKKYGIERSDVIFFINDGESDGLRFKKDPNTDSVKGLYDELKSRIPETKMYVTREEFPVNFSMDDITIEGKKNPYGWFSEKQKRL